MRKSILIAAMLACWPVAAPAQDATPAPAAAAAPAATPADDATRFVTGIIDKFNSGDTKAWVSAQADDTLIVDEFAPHTWSGPGSAQRWLDAYAKDSETNGVTGGRVDYGKPLQATSDGTTAYVVLPTTYRFMQKGMKMAEPSSMTFVMKRAGQDWKVTSWTYSAGGAPAPEK
ncbi:MAG TPA: nuclear transport factor 2 family protein [Sphingomicrobium sp.]|jgi:ketosteroid isomerase-like protein